MAGADLDNLFNLLDKVLNTASTDAFTMPSGFYTSEALLELEREQLFRKK